MSDLTDTSTGLWYLQTEHSYYILDIDARTVRRLPGLDANGLRKDDEILSLLELGKPQVGYSLTMMVQVRDDEITFRVTTAVISYGQLRREDEV
jgi:hypothetical protein